MRIRVKAVAASFLQQNAANKIDGIVSLAMASLGAVKEQSQPFAVLGAW